MECKQGFSRVGIVVGVRAVAIVAGTVVIALPTLGIGDTAVEWESAVDDVPGCSCRSSCRSRPRSGRS